MAERIITNADLSALNTLAVPSRAEYYCACSTLDELRESVHWARTKQCGVRILGGGSNVLLDEHIAGLVIRPTFAGIHVTSETPDTVCVSAGAGESWHGLVTWATSQHYSGIENLALIPGLVGAAPIQNIGAYGVEVSKFILAVECVNLHTGEEVTLSTQDCEFAYRHSVFKSERGRHFLITRVHFQLNKRFEPNLDYPALRAAFGNRIPENAAEVAKEVERIRRDKLPDPDTLPNAGSFFKNPVVSQTTYTQLKQKFPNIVAYSVAQNVAYSVASSVAHDAATDSESNPASDMARGDGLATQDASKKLAAAWLIDQRGWKNKVVHGVSVHTTQALVITNPNRTHIGNIIRLASEIQHDIRTYYGVELEVEPQSLHQVQV